MLSLLLCLSMLTLLSCRAFNTMTKKAVLNYRNLFRRAFSQDSDLPKVIDTDNVPIYLFSSQEVESQALDQLRQLANSRIPVGFVSAMPDVHLGSGATIGSVFASEKYVCPNAVGVDIGCGMIAIPFKGLRKNELTEEKKLRIQKEIIAEIPTGFNQHSTVKPGVQQALDAISTEIKPSEWLKKFQLSGGTGEKTALQLGTLGGGNHFIEVTYDESDNVWLMLHSGSRAIGKNTAEHYDAIAKEQMKSHNVIAPKELNYLQIHSPEGRAYLNDMLWCQRYAYQNREFMVNSIIKIITEVTGCPADESQRINAHHNFCELTKTSYVDPKTRQTVEKELWVTRKGATAARSGQFGIIPGSMGVGSYIIKGRGNDLSWQSCSHGAGRLMSRSAAKKQLTMDAFQRSMEGIVYDKDEPDLIDEAPMAYKNLDKVMDDQRSLVEVVHRLLPLINVKGFGEAQRNRWKKKGQKVPHI